MTVKLAVAVLDTPVIRGPLRAWPTAKIKGLHLQRNPSISYGTFFSTWPWLTWIKPSIDLAVTNGANLVAFPGLPSYAIGAGVSKATWLANCTQFLNYAQSVGVKVMWLFTDAVTADATTIDYIVSTAALLQTYPNVAAIDACNEINLHTTWADVSTYVTTIRPKLRAVCDIPISFSLSTPTASFFTDSFATSLAPYCDVMMFHPYYGDSSTISVADLTTFRASAIYKRFFLSEVGVSTTWQSGGSGFRTTQWNANGVVAREKDCVGAVGFLLSDFQAPVPNNDGMYRNDLTTGPDSDLSTAFAAWPTSY